MDSSHYLIETFEPHVGTRFTAVLPQTEDVEFRLLEVRPEVSTEKVLQFSLFFSGPGSPSLPQNVYRLTHAALGEMDFFLVPVERDAEGTKYQAVFNRFRDKAPAKP